MAAEILIVDDEADMRELISGILEDEGAPDTACARQRRSSCASSKSGGRSSSPGHLAAGQPARWIGSARRSSRGRTPPPPPPIRISRWSSFPVTATSRPPSPPSSAAPTTTSRSRSRPIASMLVTLRALEASSLEARGARARGTLDRLGRDGGQVSRHQPAHRGAIDRMAPTNSRILIPRLLGGRQGACRAPAAPEIASRRRAVHRPQRRLHGA